MGLEAQSATTLLLFHKEILPGSLQVYYVVASCISRFVSWYTSFILSCHLGLAPLRLLTGLHELLAQDLNPSRLVTVLRRWGRGVCCSARLYCEGICRMVNHLHCDDFALWVALSPVAVREVAASAEELHTNHS